MTTKSKILPFFPLGVFLLPGEDMPLRIFEPRYLQLIEEAKDEGFTFAIPFFHNNEILDYGCEVKLQQVVAETENGRKVITVEAVSLVKIVSYTSRMTDKLYAGGMVEVLPESEAIHNPVLMNRIIHYTDNFDNKFLEPFHGKEITYFDVLKSLDLSSEDKYDFLMLDSREKRDHYLIRQIEYLMLIRNQENLLKDDFRLN